MKPRILLSVLALGLAAIAAGWIYESRQKSVDADSEIEIPDNIDYYLTGMTLRAMNDDGRLDYSFSSPRLEHRPRNDTSYLETPSLQIFRNDEQWQVDSQQGRFQHEQNIMLLNRRVVMERAGPDALRLTTQSVRFEPDQDRVTVDSPLTVVSGGTRIEAQSAVFDLDRQIYSMQKTSAIYHHDDS